MKLRKGPKEMKHPFSVKFAFARMVDALTLLCWCFAQCAFAVSGVTVSPKHLNPYPGGWLTVDATVTTGAEVEVSVAVDFNGNGVKDAQDWSLYYGKIHDGVAPMTPGSPCPGDEDGLNGHLHTRLDVWGGQTAGHYLVIVKEGASQGSDTFQVDQTITSQSISGTLRDEHGAPITGLVSADPQGPALSHDAWTNADGTYTIYVPAGLYDIEGDYAMGCLQDLDGISSVEDVAVAPGEHKSGIDPALYLCARTISGRVVNSSNGLGIPYLMVEGYFESAAHDYGVFALTDANGYYHLPVVNGSWELEISDGQTNCRGLVGDNYRDQDVLVHNADVGGVDFSFSPATSYIAGTVTRKSGGAPLAGYGVWCEMEGQNSEAFVNARDDGSYVLLVQPGTWTVGVDEDDADRDGFLHAPEQEAFPGAGAPATGVDFQLEEPGAFISIWVREKGTSNPIVGTGAWVEETPGDYSFDDKDTDAQGHSVIGVVPGAYEVGVGSGGLRDEGYLPVETQTVQVDADTTQTVIFEAEKATAAISVTVREKGTTVPVGRVMANCSFADGDYVGSWGTGGQGHCAWSVAPGEYYVWLWDVDLDAQGYAPVPGSDVSVTSGETALVTFEVEKATATVNVNVSEKDSGEVVPSMKVQMWFDDWSWLGERETGGEGNCSFWLSAGSYHIDLSDEDLFARGYLMVPDQGISVASGATRQVNFEVEKAPATIEVTVLDKDSGNPVGDVEAQVSFEDWTWYGARRTDEAGNCSFGVPAGSYHVELSSDDLCSQGYTPVHYRDVSVSAGTIAQVTFEVSSPTARLNVNVSEENSGNPVGGVETIMWFDDWAWWGSKGTDGEGNCSFDVAAGAYHVRLSDDDLAARNYAPYVANRDVSIAPGQTKQINFAVEKANGAIDGTVTSGSQSITDLYVVLENNTGGWIADTQTDASGYYYFPVLAGVYWVRPDPGSLHDGGFVPVPLQEVTVTSGTTQTVNFSIETASAWVNIHAYGPGAAPLEGIHVYVNLHSADEWKHLVTLQTDASGIAPFRLKSGEYGFGCHQEDALALGCLPPDDFTLILPPTETLNPTFTFQRLSQAMCDCLTGKLSPSDRQRDFLDVNADGLLDVADVVLFLSQGK